METEDKRRKYNSDDNKNKSFETDDDGSGKVGFGKEN